MKSLLACVGRIFLSLIFIIAGIHKVLDFNGTATMMATAGVPYSELMLVLAIIFELGGGLLVFFGWFARFGALLLFLFVIPVTYTFHSFWDFQGAMAQNQMQHFLKNLAIMGGTLYIMAYGAGAISIDYFRTKGK